VGVRMNDDFETVRAAIYDVEAYGQRWDAKTALDRIEAEVERLRALLRGVLDFADPNEPTTWRARDALTEEKA
jgi:hypothetical protein